MPEFNFGPENPFYQGFEEDPEGQLANFLARFRPGLGRGQFDAAQSLFQPYRGRYRALAGRQILGGQQRADPWSDFLNRFDFDRLLRREAPARNRGLVSPASFLF